MGRILLFIFLLIATTSVTYGQYRADSWTISPKISFADYSDTDSYENYSISKIPPISVFVEKGINDYFSAGGFMGYNRDKYNNDTIPENELRYTTFSTGAVATIHYAHWIEALSGHQWFLGDFDLYVSGVLQAVFESSNEQHVWNPADETFNNHKESEVKFRLRPIFGMRYFLTPRFSMLLEVGRGNPGMVTTGVSWVLGSGY
ncbi:outer membrane beta-barrel protein [Marinilabilia sp.]|uniref:outer membrane beta-barrel protein n=1 Tax=Marinilabilia sp. TaxID=2021252 RepID=UPI0025BF00D5|nr:outer membrane beta-barrel protein [Marinilabilia sp.]